jgi:hypothetical protein
MRRATAVLLGLVLTAAVAPALTWNETSRQDFSDGQLSDNLYASHRDGGTVEFEWAFDLNNDGYCDLMCADRTGPYLRVYFGSPAGYSPSRCRLLPIVYGGGCDVADLDCDGHSDLVHSGWHDRASIFWGTDSGPNPGSPQQLDADGAETVTVDDLDNDGYIDLIFPGEDGTLAIYWGSASGFSTGNRMLIPFDYGLSHNATIADLDKDGFKDIVLCMYQYNDQQPVVHMGPGRTHRIEWLDYLSSGDYGPHGTTVADFNRDGWLDIVYSGYNGVDQSYIYFGSDSGFSDSRRTTVTPGVCYGGSASCDFNGDGWLDLIYFPGNGNYGGYWKPAIFLNTGSAPYFSDGQIQFVGPDSVALSGGLAADFNRDGNLDIYLDGYDPYGSKHTPSMVLWGPGWMTADTLPSQVDHHGMFREPGNIYDRSYREDYVSSVFDGANPTNWHTVSWDDSTPGGSSVDLAVRTGSSSAPDSTWSGWYAVANGDTVPDSLNSRYIQYQATLKYQNPASLPMLFEVRIDYGASLTQDVGPTVILTPVGTVDSGTQVTPAVVVRNFGTSTAVFPTTLAIGSGYSQTLSETLAAGVRDTMSFPDWTAGPVGTLGVTCFTALAGDQNPTNDTITDSVRVRRVYDVDVAPIKLLSPAGTVDSGAVYQPSVVVRNLGRTAAGFPVTMQLGAGYSATVPETLAPGLSDTLVFPTWTAEPVGRLAVTCYTALVGDEDPTNDTISDSVRVVGPPLHDVGAVTILAPTGTVRAWDTVIPRARVRNFGNTVERFFNVRLRIGTGYNRAALAAQILYPDSTVELTFAPWVAASGNWAVSCSTMLDNDENRANDKVTSTVRGVEQLLHIEPDQTDRLEIGTGKTYQFHALIEGDTGGVVEVARPTAPTGWSARLGDATGTNDLIDTDGDGTPDLGFLDPGVQRVFSLEVMTPSGLAGDTAALTQKTFVIAGHMGNDSTVADTALLNLTLVPGFSVHNFPNPFSDRTAFVIGLPADGEVSLTVYTRAGERVCRVIDREDEPTGVHVVRWEAVNDNGRGVAPGTYEYVLDYVHQGKTDRIRKRLVVTRE